MLAEIIRKAAKFRSEPLGSLIIFIFPRESGWKTELVIPHIHEFYALAESQKE